MASGRFFDPLVALRAAPLVSATCSLVFARDQEFFLQIFGEAQNRQRSNALLPGYFTCFFYRGTPLVLSLLAITMGTSVANLYTRRSVLAAHGSLSWYIAGGILALGHLLFVPVIAPACKTLVEAQPTDDNHKTLDAWRQINWVRGVTVDLGAWIALVVAMCKTLEAN